MAAVREPLLVELGTEELPVKALPGLAQALFDNLVDGLAKRGIAFDRGEAKPLYTPRRLAVLLPGVAVEQDEQRSEVLGPYLNVALDADGQPTRALQGFAQKAGVEWTALERTTDAKGERFVHRAVTPGSSTANRRGVYSGFASPRSKAMPRLARPSTRLSNNACARPGNALTGNSSVPSSTSSGSRAAVIARPPSS